MLKYNSTSTSPKELSFTILGSKENPIINPCFIIKNWIAQDLKLMINGEPLIQGKDYRIGIRYLLESSDIIL